MLAGSGTPFLRVPGPQSTQVEPGRNVSGWVPKEKVAAVTVVLAVTPERFRTNVAGPIVVRSMLLEPVVFTFVAVPPSGMAGVVIWAEADRP